MNRPYRILVIEDEPVIGMEIEAFLAAQGFEVIGIARDAATARQMYRAPYPDAVILDINLGGDDGIELAQELNFSDQVPLIYLTAHGDQGTVHRARETRPTSYLLKPFNERELFAAIDLGIFNHLRGKSEVKPISEINGFLTTALTPRELAVVEELMKGKANREIADALFVTIHTVKSQLQTVFDKFDVRNRTELMFRINELLS
jgi:DNA-binding NarL/FixJ family response regulator